MRNLRWGILLVAGCTYPEYWLDPANPCRLDSKIDVVVDTPERLAPRSRAALRVVVTEGTRAGVRGLDGAPVRVAIEDSKGKSTAVFEGRTADGACTANFTVPDLPDGSYTVRVETRDYTVRNPVQIKRDYRILLTTDKPLYQPGQKMRVRALALSSLSLRPVEKEELVFEIEDAKGNKVFKRKIPTSEYGIAVVDFQIADEVVMGDWKITATLGTISFSRAVGVKRYVLPKFHVVVHTDRPFYLPGEKIQGTLQADYFFGKPVSGEAVVKLLAVDAEVREVARASGRVESGRMTFEIPLDAYFVGVPVNKGMANVLLVAQVTDSAGHAEKAARPIPVAREALQVSAVPESGRIVPLVENRIYVALYTPDGSAATGEVEIAIGEWRGSAKTDDGGIAVVLYPAPPALRFDRRYYHHDYSQPVHAVVSARDSTGRTARAELNLIQGEAPGGLLVRPERALYATGETMNLEILSTVRKGSAFLDMVREGQTLLTLTVPLQGGRARHGFDIPPDLFGAIEVRAYCVMPNGDILRDARLVYVEPASDLKIDVVAGKDVYEPGEDAKIRFHVTDRSGNARAALGVAIVDEAVFALQEMRPGLEKVYFTIQEELMEPKYGIKTLPETIERRMDAVATMLLASQREKDRRAVNTLAQRERVMRPRLERWYRAFEAYIVDHRIEFLRDGGWAPDFFERVSRHSGLYDRDMRDAWGYPMTLATLERLDERFTLEHWRKRRNS